MSSNRIIGFHLTGKRRGRGGGLRRGEGEGFHDIVLEETFNAIHCIYNKYHFRISDKLIKKLNLNVNIFSL